MNDSTLPEVQTEVIELSLPTALVNEIKILANKLDIDYQAWIKLTLYRAMKEEKGELPRPMYDLIYDKSQKTYKAKK